MADSLVVRLGTAVPVRAQVGDGAVREIAGWSFDGGDGGVVVIRPWDSAPEEYRNVQVERLD